MDASLFGRGAGEGMGVHICTGPVAVKGAEAGRRARGAHPGREAAALPATRNYAGKTFGSNAAAWWGFHYKDLIEEPKPREVITIYEVDATGERDWAKAVYNFRWMPQTDPFGSRAQDHRLPRRARGPRVHQGEPRHPEERARAGPSAFRRAWGWRRRRPTWWTRSRRATRAATSTTGASARARRCITRSPSPARCSRWATRTPRRAIRSCAALPSNAR